MENKEDIVEKYNLGQDTRFWPNYMENSNLK